MPFTIPDHDLVADNNQSIWFATDVSALVSGFSGTGVTSGCVVSAQGTPDMTVAVAAGVISAAGVQVAVTAGNLSVTADATNPRLGLVSVAADGTKTYTPGTPAADPRPPSLPSGHAALAFVFVPANDTAVSSSQIVDKRVVIAGGGTSLGSEPLKSSPTDDFSGSALDGAWSAHNSQGSFATTDCATRMRNGSYLRQMFASKMGVLYRTKANADLDISIGGLRGYGQVQSAQQVMWGIAALNSSGTGVAMVVYNDSNIYLANITTWLYASVLQTISGRGHNVFTQSEYWLRLVRVGNNWTGYYSLNGAGWSSPTSASSVTITVDRVAIGLFYNTATAYDGFIDIDWYDE